MALSDSPLSSVHLRKRPKRFHSLLGLHVQEFDHLFDKVYKAERDRQYKNHGLWTIERVERLVSRYEPTLREHLCVAFLYLRQYPLQDVLAASFEISQGQISRIIKRMLPLLIRVLPTPSLTVEKLHSFLLLLPKELREEYAATLIIDASEQRIERSTDYDQQKKDYSGKKSATAANFNLSSPKMR